MGHGIQIVLSFLLVLEAHADGYGSGIAKNTFAASDPHSCKNFFFEYFPVRCQDDFACNMSTPCMTSGRVALCNADSMISETKCVMPDGGGPGGGSPGQGGIFGNLLHGGKGPPPGAGGGPDGAEGLGGEGEDGGEESNGDESSSWFGFIGKGGPPPPPPGPGGDFGLHTVNASSRPGHQELLKVEKSFEHRFNNAVELNQYDVFMDFSTVFYTKSLDRYITAFNEDDVPFVVLRWQDDGGNHMYSLIVRACGQVIIELVSISAPSVEIGKELIEDDVKRLPASVFKDTNAFSADHRILTTLAVSKAVSENTLPKAIDFYMRILEAAQVHEDTTSGTSLTHVSTYRLANANALVRLIYRSDALGTNTENTQTEENEDESTGSEEADGSTEEEEQEEGSTEEEGSSERRQLTLSSDEVLGVSDVEDIKHMVRDAFWQDKYCGVDKFIDNHFAWDQFTVDLTTKSIIFDQEKIKYHIFGDGTMTFIGGAPTNLYVTDPTGDSIQMDGRWSETPTGGASDSLQDGCSQGNCCGKGATAALVPPNPHLRAPEDLSAKPYPVAVRDKGNCTTALLELAGISSSSYSAASVPLAPLSLTSLWEVEKKKQDDKSDTSSSSEFLIADSETGELAEDARVACINKAYSMKSRAKLLEQQCEPADVYLFCMDTEDICNPSIFQRIKKLIASHARAILLGILACCLYSCCGGVVVLFMNTFGCMAYFCPEKPKAVVSGLDDDDFDAKDNSTRHGGDVEMTSTSNNMLPALSEQARQKLGNTPTVAAVNNALTAMSSKLGLEKNQQGAYAQVNTDAFGDDEDDMGTHETFTDSHEGGDGSGDSNTDFADDASNPFD